MGRRSGGDAPFTCTAARGVSAFEVWVTRVILEYFGGFLQVFAWGVRECFSRVSAVNLN